MGVLDFALGSYPRLGSWDTNHGLKETAKGSFMKFTAHVLLKELKKGKEIGKYKVKASNKSHEILKRDAMAIEIYSKKFAKQPESYFCVIHAATCIPSY